MVKQLKYQLTFILTLIVGFSSAQFSIGGGPTVLAEFGNKKPFYGLHVTGEYAKGNSITFYGRLTYLFKQNKTEFLSDLPGYAKDISTYPQTINVPLNNLTSVSYFMIDGGTRYYIINGFDEGFSLYGGTNLALIVNSVKYGYDIGKYDSTKYDLYAGDFSESRDKGSIIRFAVGFTGGMKYTVPRFGSLYFDFNPQITLFGIPSVSGIPSTVYKPVFFGFNIGYRKIFF